MKPKQTLEQTIIANETKAKTSIIRQKELDASIALLEKKALTSFKSRNRVIDQVQNLIDSLDY